MIEAASTSTARTSGIIHPGSSTVTLTVREREVASLLSAGLSHKKVASRLGLNVSTVGVYVHNIAQRIPGSGSPTLKVAVWFLRHQTEHIVDR